MSKVKIGLALGGGGVRGFCHTGVLKVLEEHNIRPYAIAGTSMGAVVGGVYASGAEISEIAKFADELNMIKIADL
ncbi:MAG: patatin-like phospholipase family protein, partial [Christensenellales bacterium]